MARVDWPLADGLDEPIDESLVSAIEDAETITLIASIDGFPLGFLLAPIEPLLAQAGDARVGTVRLIFTDPDAQLRKQTLYLQYTEPGQPSDGMPVIWPKTYRTVDNP